MGWLILIAYVLIGAMLVPRFTRAAYVVEEKRYSFRSKAESLREAAGIGWAKSLIWPVFLVIHVAVERITAEEREIAAEKERAKTVEGARAVIARFEAEEKRKWDSAFHRNGGLL